ncbi:chemotaxis protein CheW [Cystobacter fuscus]
MPGTGSHRFLLVRARSWMCALPLDEVEETMRPLPVTPVASAPAFVRGVSLVRGTSAPVVSLGALLSGGAAEPCMGGRFVSLRVPEGRLVIEVDEVRGLSSLEADSLEAVPSLLRETAQGHVQRLGALDGHLLAVLGSSHLLPRDVWDRLTRSEGKELS